jgi:malate dehydrogenase (oxaloacetate-decarboxylating)
MKLAAIEAIAQYVSDEELSPNYLLPNPLDKNLSDTVAKAVAAAVTEQRDA